MPKYFFLFNDETSLDGEGKHLPDDTAALQEGTKEARAMAAESVRKGHLILDHRIEVAREDGRIIGTIHFRDAVKVK